MHSHLALTGYPLSAGYKAKLAQVVGADCKYINLRDFKTKNPFILAVRLRRLNAQALFIPLEDQNSAALVPILVCMAAFTRVSKIFLVDAKLQSKPVLRIESIPALLGFVVTTVALQIDAFRARQRIKRLLSVPRAEVQYPTKIDSICYLKTNMWFGVKVGGSIGHIAGVVNGFLNRGAKVDYVCADEAVLISPKASIINVPPPEGYGVPFELNHLRFQSSFLKALCSNHQKYSFIYQRLSVGNFVGVTWSRKQQMPLVLEYNGSEVWVAKNWGGSLASHQLMEKVENVSLRHAHLVVTVSDVLKEELIQRGVEPKRIACYPNCIDPEIFDPSKYSKAQSDALRSQLGIPKDAVVATFVGTFGQWHGVEILAEAAAKILADKSLQHVHFLIIGDGLLMPRVREIAEASVQFGNRIHLPGLIAQDKLPAFLAASDILVSPHVPNADGSRFFGSPTKLFEYMAMDKPIIASRLEQIAEVLANGEDIAVLEGSGGRLPSPKATAIFTKPGSVDELTSALRYAFKNIFSIQHLGENARAEALAKYTWDRHVDVILQALGALGKPL